MTNQTPALSPLAQQVLALEHCLLVVRHGQTEWNVEDRVCTREDVPLTAKGAAQAKTLSARLAGVSFDYAWTSPLARARETLELVLGENRDVSARVDNRLAEPDAGPFEGEVFGELPTGSLATAWAGYQDEINPVIPSGAVDPEIAAREALAFVQMVGAMKGRHVATTHGALARMMGASFLGMPTSYYRRLRIDNCHAALWKFYEKPPHQLAGWNLG